MVWKIQTGELAVVEAGRRVVSTRGVFGCVVAAKRETPLVGGDNSVEASALLEDAFEPDLVISLDAGVRAVLARVAYPEIAAAIVPYIAIDVIDDHAVGGIQNEARQ